MSDNLPSITVESIGNVLTEVEEAFYDIPFGNTDFQMRHFVIATNITPARAYRSLGLEMLTRIEEVRKMMLDRELRQVDIDEGEHIVATTDNEFTRRRAEIKLKELRSGANQEEKRLNDTLHILDLLYAEFRKYPRYTREQFEAEEMEHFDKRLHRQLQFTHTAQEPLTNMYSDSEALPKMLESVRARLK